MYGLFFCDIKCLIHTSHTVSTKIKCHIGKSQLFQVRINLFPVFPGNQSLNLIRQHFNTRNIPMDSYAHLMKSQIKQ